VRPEELFQAIDELCKLRDIKNKDSLYQAIQSGLQLAFRKSSGSDSVEVYIDEKKKEFKIIERRKVVARVTSIHREISLKEALMVNPSLAIGDTLETIKSPSDLDRIAADTFKQVVMQKLRDAEIDTIYEDFKAREHEMILGEVSKITYRNVFVNLGRIEGILPEEEQIRNERYRNGEKIHCYILNVMRNQRDPHIRLSRTHPHLVVKLMNIEIPELQQKLIEIKNVVREPGVRSKVSVFSKETKIDPVGTCIGTKGTRINAVGQYLNGEKIDVIRWNEDIKVYIAHSLSPAKVLPECVELDIENKHAKVFVDQEYFSLAIGKDGLNVKLAARLTGFKMDVAVR
jgi:transcription termination/antitermination protein NusA